MSILFGIRQAEGHLVEESLLRRMASATDRYALDGTFVKENGRVGMGFQPYHTHERSTIESQPAVNRRGDMLTFDGRLDNSIELCKMLALDHEQTPDSLIVLESFASWGQDCFSRFIGDWAIALWASDERSLYLARDHAGTRTLYYMLIGEELRWATYLESLLIEAGDVDLNEVFAAAYLSAQPIRDLTPYKNIQAVSPAHYFLFREGKVTKKTHWDWLVQQRIRYRSDAEYDEHFIHLFRNAVERRTGRGAPIIAELSGGVDSTSIVCMSDHIREAQGAAPADLIDTVSYYDNSEPNWNEIPYFTAVEQSRGKSGLHIEVSRQSATFEPPVVEYLWPGPEKQTLVDEQALEERLSPGRYRVVLSGIGGDELLGGPPDPLPELADYLVSLQLQTLLTQGVEWGLAKRMPLIHLLGDTATFVIRLYMRRPRCQVLPPLWLSGSTHRQAARLRSLTPSGSTFGHLPSSIDNGLMWSSIMESLSRPAQRLVARREYRYPLLDRDLVDFLIRIPPNQLLRPGRRRLMMRRALQTIVPSQVLERKRKAHVMRGPAVVLAENKPKLCSLIGGAQLMSREYIDENALQSAITKFDPLLGGSEQRQLMRAIQFELWMRRTSNIHMKSSFSS